MFVNKMARYELLSPDAVEVLDRGVAAHRF